MITARRQYQFRKPWGGLFEFIDASQEEMLAYIGAWADSNNMLVDHVKYNNYIEDNVLIHCWTVYGETENG